MFMKPIVTWGEWLIAETNCGTEVVPFEYIGDLENVDKIQEFVEGDEIISVESAVGYGVRLSAPGYLDCTSWAFFEKLDEAETHIQFLIEDFDSENQ